MEQILALYALPYDLRYPVICFDERPCFLIGDRLAPMPMRPGQVRTQHYTYEKLGSCALLAAIEPLTGRRFGQVHARRTKREYTLFCQALATQYPDAIKIRLVQDNLNTHNASAFYEHLPAAAAYALAERFEFIYTPKAASWLNMIECEFAVITRLCLNRRIPTIEHLGAEVGAWPAWPRDRRHTPIVLPLADSVIPPIHAAWCCSAVCWHRSRISIETRCLCLSPRYKPTSLKSGFIPNVNLKSCE